MFILSLIAAGFVAVAALLTMTSRSAPVARTADQRGITLQTLIVTAVLVLMAVAAGVVIVAITRNAQDNVESSADFQTDANCNGAEIYKPALAAEQVFGRNIGGSVMGSAIGCVPVCTITYPADAAMLAMPSNIKLGYEEGLLPGQMVVLTSGQVTAIEMNQAAGLAAAYTADTGTAPGTKIKSRKQLFKDPLTVYLYKDKMEDFTSTPPMLLDGQTLDTSDVTDQMDAYEIVGVRVAANQRQCHAYDATGQIATIFGT